MNDSMTLSSTPVPATSGGSAARLNEFWQWWTGELRALVPAQVTSWVVGDVAVTDVMVDGTGIRVMRMEGGKPRVAATVPAGEVATHPVLRELRAKGNDRVRVLLGPDQVLLKSLTLPAAIEENLREVMGFELDRHTPFMAGQAYYDVKLLRRDASRESIEVLLAVASRSVVDPLLAALRQAGLSVDAVTVVDADTAGQTIELLPVADKPGRKWGNMLKLNLVLLALAVALGMLALLLPIWQKREQVIALNPLVGRANADFAVSQRVHDEYTKLANEYNYITGKKQGMHPSLAIIEELTRISPDTTSVQSLDLKSSGKTREVILVGEALAASRVIEVLEQSPLFQNASQRAQTRRGSLGTNEWFHIATEVKPRILPAPVKPDDVTSTAIETIAAPAPAAAPAAPLIGTPVTAGAPGTKTLPVPETPAAGGAKLEAPVATVSVPTAGKAMQPIPPPAAPPAAKVPPAEPVAQTAPANRKQP